MTTGAGPSPDWAFLEAQTRAIASTVESLTDRVVAEIRRQLPEYVVVTEDDQRERVAEQIRGLIAGLAARRQPGPLVAEHGRALGRRRAEQGVAANAVVNACHIACQLVWQDLRAQVMRRDPGRVNELLPLLDLLWSWLRSITSALTDGYASASAAREESREALAQAFLIGLVNGGADGEDPELIARALGFDPAGDFQAICGTTAGSGDPRPVALRRPPARQPGTAVAVVRGTALTVILQGVPADEVLSWLDGDPLVGVGLVRGGVGGAADSVGDAERALALAERRGRSAAFESDWLLASLLPQLPRLQALADPGRAGEQPHLVDAVMAYARNGFSISAAAGQMHLHPNTVKYRLQRWHEVTGWDPRQLDGLLRSLVSQAGAQWRR